MRTFIMLTAIALSGALAGCQAAPENTTAAKEPEAPMGVGPLQDREFAQPLIGVARAGNSEAVLRLDPVEKVIYFGTRVNGKIKEQSVPYVAPELQNTAGRLETKGFNIQFARYDCKNDMKELGKGTITGSVSPTDAPETSYMFCLVPKPKDARPPSWSKKGF